MDELDFYVEFNIEVDGIDEEFKQEADHRLWQLAKGNTDIVGSSVSLENIVKVESPYLYQVRIVVYKRPEYLAVIEKDAKPMTALKNALDAIERRVRESREMRSESQLRKADDVDNVILALSEREVYDSYGENADLADLIKEGRTKLASRMMIDYGLSEVAAFTAADKMIQFAQSQT